MKTKFDIDLIDRYIEGKLTNEDLILFEEKLKSDPEFAQDVETHKMAINVIFLHSRDELKKKLNDIHDNRMNKAFTMNVSYRVAASIAVIFLVSSVVFYLAVIRTPDYSKLFDDTFVPYQDMISQQSRGDNNENKTLINDAMNYYNQKKFDKAILIFDKILRSKQSNDAVIYYYGISCLGSKENNIAIELLSQLSVNPESMFYEQARWYLALGYLFKKDKENTVKILHDIIRNKTFNNEKAKELLDDLE
jgi:tetratricopeptide (TPR) repeat protein